jgi:3-oxoacyl-[acyl-carrier-protein] synthase-3
MAYFRVKNVAIRGISACVPSTIEENTDLDIYSGDEAAEVIKTTGIERKHVCRNGETGSDLCLKAAGKIITELGWEKNSIDLLCFVTQCPDYINQPTSFVVHEKLGLPESCACLDIFHGCPGWVIGLNTVSNYLSNGCIKRALLCVADTISTQIAVNDRGAKPLFGDAGTVTALEFDETASDMMFSSITKSADGKALIKLQGGAKHPWTLDTLKFELDKHAGLIDMDLVEDKMDGMDVFAFAISTVPKSIKKLCEAFAIDRSCVDKFIFHQANKLMIDTFAKRLKVDASMVPMCLKEYGNTTQASIPLTIVAECAEEYSEKQIKTIACGFGTGLACATVYFETNNIVVPKVIEY